MKLRFIGVLLTLSVATPLQASAAVMIATYNGQVVSGFDNTGQFGTGTLVGKAVKAVFRYDTNRGTRVSDASHLQVIGYGSSSPIREARVTINGATAVLDPTFAMGQVNLSTASPFSTVTAVKTFGSETEQFAVGVYGATPPKSLNTPFSVTGVGAGFIQQFTTPAVAGPPTTYEMALLLGGAATLKVQTYNSWLNDITRGSVSVTTQGSKIFAYFTPNGMSLDEAAAAMGYAGFNWSQTITAFPNPSPFRSWADPNMPLVAPFPDPIPGGFNYQPNYNAYPFYYTNQLDPAYANSWVEKHKFGSNTLTFLDNPGNPCFGPLGLIYPGCDGQIAPLGSAMYFTTELVGVNADGSRGGTLFSFDWKSDFNGVFGGVARLNSDGSEADPGATGGATLLNTRYLSFTPEPSTWALSLVGFFGLGAMLRRRRHLQLHRRYRKGRPSSSGNQWPISGRRRDLLVAQRAVIRAATGVPMTTTN